MAAAATQQQQPAKVRWGDDLEEDDCGCGDLDYLLPPPVVVGPDENGVKKVIEYRFDGDGNKVKVTTTKRVCKLARRRFSKSAIERRSWPKFGDAAKGDAGSRLTMVSTEEILLDRTRAQGTKAEEATDSAGPLASKEGGGVLMVCRTCGKKGDHWTSKCPYKDLAPPTETFVDRPNTGDGPSIPTGDRKKVYVPPIPHDRDDPGRRGADVMRRRNDENSVRVNNLSEDTTEPDLRELFEKFGPVSRVYVAADRITGAKRGFGFVNFVHREDGENAIKTLDGYGYDNLILRVEWAAPRPN
ncbi:hypothetical protein ACP70R_027933 [Stipagrostis hirtigluma subsp. patula]